MTTKVTATTKTLAEQAYDTVTSNGATEETRRLLASAREVRADGFALEQEDAHDESTETWGKANVATVWVFADGSAVLDSDSEFLIHDVLGLSDTITVDGEEIEVLLGEHDDYRFAVRASDVTLRDG